MTEPRAPKPTRSLHELGEERVVPWGEPDMFAWHRARYAFALQFVKGARVLDVGSGEGYGAAMVADLASEVVGVDYAPVAVEHANAAYPAPNLSFRVADAVPLPDDLTGFDVAICFEVIEHLADPPALLRSIRGALRPGGVLVLSTPNRLVDELFERVSGRDTYEYHVSMLAPAELRQLAKREFEHVTLYGQSVRRSAIHSVVKAADILNVRHRLVRSHTAQAAIASALQAPRHEGPPRFRLSRFLVRQSPHIVLVARV